MGASAPAISRLSFQGSPIAEWTSTAITAAVRNVPANPRIVIGTSSRRNRDQPICIPPSNRIRISAKAPIRSTSVIDSTLPRAGKMLVAIAEQARNSAGAGNPQPLSDAGREECGGKPERDDQDDPPNSETSPMAESLLTRVSRGGQHTEDMAEGFVGIMQFELHLPESGSLKAKRKHLLHTKAQLEHRFGASVARSPTMSCGSGRVWR